MAEQTTSEAELLWRAGSKITRNAQTWGRTRLSTASTIGMLSQSGSLAALLPAMTSPPTVTTATTADGTLSRSYALGASPALDYNFRVSGELGRVAVPSTVGQKIWTVSVPGAGNQGTGKDCAGCYVEWMQDCLKCSIETLSAASVGIEIDQLDGLGFRFVSFTNTVAATNATGTSHIFLTFATRAIRRIRLHYTFGGMAFFTVRVKPTETVWKPESINPMKLQIFGDSHAIGTGSTFAGITWPKVVCGMLGIDNYCVSAIGGTGYQYNAAGGKWRYDAHIGDIDLYQPDVLWFLSSSNDRIDDDGGIESIMLSTLAAARVKAPLALIIVSGMVGSSTGLPGSETRAKAAFDTWADPNSVWIPVHTDVGGRWLSGSGTIQAPSGDGNTDFYVGTADSTHMVYQGHAYFGRRFYNILRKIL